MSEPARSGRARALVLLHRVEDAVLALLLGAMVLLASLQIFLRQLFDEGLTWADPLLRVLVLWVGLVGAIAASRDRSHITVDVLSRVFRGRARGAVGLLANGFTAAVCAVLGWQSWRFVESELEAGGDGFLGVPVWAPQSILPFAFTVIAIRYALHALGDARVLLGLRPPYEPRVEGSAK